MGFLATPAMVAAICSAGGLGGLGSAIEPADSLKLVIDQIRALTDRPSGVDLLLDVTAFGPATTKESIVACIEKHVPSTAVSPLRVLASGGIADGAGVIKARANGAEGVRAGTRLVASTKAFAHEEYKQRVVDANGNDTVRAPVGTPVPPEAPETYFRRLPEWR